MVVASGSTIMGRHSSMTPMTYVDLSDEEQVEVLRAAALAATDQFGFEVVRLEVAAHVFNTTFAADTADGARYAGRVSINSPNAPANIVAQQAWQRATAAETGALVPELLETPDGGRYMEVESKVFGRPLRVTAASWLERPDVAGFDAVVARELGRTMTLLHEQSTPWHEPAGAPLPIFDAPLLGDENLPGSAARLEVGQRAVLDQTGEQSARAFTAVYDGASLRRLHADVHRGILRDRISHSTGACFPDVAAGWFREPQNRGPHRKEKPP